MFCFNIFIWLKYLKPQMYDPRIFWDPIILHDVKDDLDLVLKYPRRQNLGVGGREWDERKKSQKFSKNILPTLQF